MSGGSVTPPRLRILVTGGTGLFGVNAARILGPAHDVILARHERPSRMAGVEQCVLAFGNVQRLRRQITDLRPDVVLHAAAWADVERCERDPHGAMEVNAGLASEIADATVGCACRLVHLSSDQVFPGTQSWTAEEEPPDPLNAYGRSKAEAERGVMKHNCRALIVRTNFFGWGPPHRPSLTDWLLSRLAAGRAVHGFVDVWFTPVHVATLTNICVRLASRSIEGVVHVGSRDRVSKFEFCSRVADAFGYPASLVQPGTGAADVGRAPRPRDMSLATRRLAALGEKVPSVAEGIACLASESPAGRSPWESRW